MFCVEWAVADGWELEIGDYFLQDGPARTAAKRGTKQDGRARRVVTYPGGVEVWRTSDPTPRRQKLIRETA